MKKPLIAANWKMHKTKAETEAFFKDWNTHSFPDDREVAFFPSFTLISVVRDLLPGGHLLGAQNCHEKEKGAFTGEVSCSQLLDAGCSYVLVGHSERRHLFGEGDGRVSAKFKAAIEAGLRPMLCVGETLAQREKGATLETVLGQLEADLGTVFPLSGFDVAYEPVWAIGTGKVAGPKDAEVVHSAIRAWLDERKSGGDSRILYGGSVKPANAAELLAVPEMDGVLVGGASLDSESFHAILTAGI